jgi:hypothetical protein
MAQRRVLLLDAEGLTAYRCSGNAVAVEARFQRAAEGFAAYLGAHADVAFFLLVNLPDESFEAENIPHVRGWGRAAMMARKREKHAHGSALCLALPGGREADGRRDDRYLFVALTGMPALQPWLQAMELAAVPMSGVYATSQIMAILGDRSVGQSHVLVTVTRGGLRQTFVADGRLRFSRLTPLPSGTAAEAASACLRETGNLHRYLCAQRLAGREQALPVLVLADPLQMEDFRRICIDSAETQFSFRDLAVEAKRHGLASLTDSHADALFAHMLARRPPAEQFAPSQARRHWRLARMGRALDIAGIAMLAATLSFAALHLPGALRMRDEAAQLRASNDADEARYRASQSNMPAFRLPVQELRELALAREALVRASPGPAPLLLTLSRALDRSGVLELQAVDWRVASAAMEVVDIRGSVPGLAPLEQQQSVKQLIAQLGAEPGIQAQVVKLPFDAESGPAVKHAADVSREADGDFIVRLGRKL